MIETVANDAAGWSGLRTIDIAIVRSFEVRIEESEQIVRQLPSDGGRRLVRLLVQRILRHHDPQRLSVSFCGPRMERS
jgi:hypothetical protein